MRRSFPTGAALVGTLAVWVIAALFLRFGGLVIGSDTVKLRFFVAFVLLVTSSQTGAWLAERLGFAGAWTAVRPRSKFEQLVREEERRRGAAARPYDEAGQRSAQTTRALGAPGCALAVLALAAAAWLVWSYAF